MTDKPILFSGPMVRAILDGRKTQTRRVLKPQPDYRGGYGHMDDPEEWGWEDENGAHVSVTEIAPNGFSAGNRLWVREAWQAAPAYDDVNPSEMGGDESILYAADGVWESWGWGDTGCINGGRKRPSMFMPRWASRLTLIVEDVRVQRLQEISRGDAMDEGCPFPNMADGPDPRDWFHELWDGLNAARGFGWDVNPWVVAVTFRTIRANIDSEEVRNAA